MPPNHKKFKKEMGIMAKMYIKNNQQLVIIILGITAVISLIGTIIIITITNNTDTAIITSLITFTSGITGGLIGYLGSKTDNNDKVGHDENMQ